MMASKVGFRIGTRKTTCCKNYSENMQEKGRKPQLHKAKLGQRRCCTASLALSAGSPFGACIAKQVACVLPTLENESCVFSVSGSQFSQKFTVFAQIRSYQSSTH